MAVRRRHSVIRRFAEPAPADDTGRADRKIYICWQLPKLAGDGSQSTQLQSNWVRDLYQRIKIVRADTAGAAVQTVELDSVVGESNDTERQNRRDGTTDFIFIATSGHIELHQNLVAQGKLSDLKWFLDLQQPGDRSAPRIWFLPLESIFPSWIRVNPDQAEPTLNSFVWHLPDPSPAMGGRNWGDAQFELQALEQSELERGGVLDKVRRSLMVHGEGDCDLCKTC